MSNIRAAFETWHKKEFGYVDLGYSACDEVERRWITWKAAIEAAKPAQDLGAVLDEEWLDLWCPEALRISPMTASALRLLLSRAERDIRVALASPADALISATRIIEIAEHEGITFITDERRPDDATIISFARAILAATLEMLR